MPIGIQRAPEAVLPASSQWARLCTASRPNTYSDTVEMGGLVVTSSVLPWMKTSESLSLEDRAAAQDLTRARPADVCSDSNHLSGIEGVGGGYC